MGAFAAPLVEAGFRALALDAPGHGRSPGNSTSLFQIRDAIQQLADDFGPLQGIITHSFGAMVVTRALRDGLEAGRVVCIAAPTRLAFLVDSFCQALEIPARVRADLIRRMQLRFGDDIEAQIAADVNAAQLDLPALIIHDREDTEVPWHQAEQLARAWPGARLLLTRGLGHTRILRHRDVIRASVAFLSGASD
jgi:pimeloyl-ACP methyl ester carboxylesterase